jgi:hypothetical protein
MEQSATSPKEENHQKKEAKDSEAATNSKSGAGACRGHYSRRE